MHFLGKKFWSPQRRRSVSNKFVRRMAIGIQRAHRLMQLARSMWYYRPLHDDREIIAKLEELADRFPTDGFRIWIRSSRSPKSGWSTTTIINLISHWGACHHWYARGRSTALHTPGQVCLSWNSTRNCNFKVSDDWGCLRIHVFLIKIRVRFKERHQYRLPYTPDQNLLQRAKSRPEFTYSRSRSESNQRANQHWNSRSLNQDQRKHHNRIRLQKSIPNQDLNQRKCNHQQS